MRQSKVLLIVVFLLGSCISIDYEDDPIVGERIELDRVQVPLRIGEVHQAQAIFYDQYGLQKQTTFVWTSSHPQIVLVNEGGLITAQSVGQASVIVKASGVEATISVNVILDENQVASVVISSPANQTSLGIGEMVSLSAVVNNIDNEPLPGRTIEWFSENSALATVNENGVVTGTGMGMVDIHAKSEGVKSNIITFSVGQGLTGNFIAAGGYKAVGMATLSVMDNKLILQFSNNFETSFALGTFVYLANSTNGAQVRASGLEIAQISTNGAKMFDISAISPSTGLLDYKYVIILCKPASLTFGYAELK